MAKTYDSKCYDLAKEFLDDSDAGNGNPHRRDQLADLLANDIQDAIEFFFKAHEIH